MSPRLFLCRSFIISFLIMFFFFSSRRRHTRLQGDWSSDVCSSDLDILLVESLHVALVERPDVARGSAGWLLPQERATSQQQNPWAEQQCPLHGSPPVQKESRPSECLAQPVSRFAPLEAWAIRTTARRGVHSI